MSDIAIRVEHLGKRYRIGGKQAGYRTFREALLDGLSAPLRWARGERQSYDTFWALDDISFEVRQGEAVGIIGRNGAGKSTLLKILSRITKPTTGRVELYGRVASLLEVGTGFHPELSGRDNIYLNGAILGMSRAEIARKFDEIVEFSGVEKFLDTPVKRYSSGMYVRLAFSVAAHLEPEILVVDEVLAVGDAEFQKKCLGKMGEVANQGRTVLFVSHNMAAVSALCKGGIVLQTGRMLGFYAVNEAINAYLTNVLNPLSRIHPKDRRDRQGNGKVQITDVKIMNQAKESLHQIPLNEGALSFQVDFEGQEGLRFVWVAIGIYDALSRCVLWLDSRALNLDINVKRGGNHVVCSLASGFSFAKGTYNVNVAVFESSDMLDYLPGATSFEVVDGDFYGTGKLSGGEPAIYVKQEWKSW
ncbi:MAG: ABC transporter ATP-binding protein [Chloroflexi bacterium]|nr:ABC transporter ATP-binding protein [Chloroflexota bacterium]